MEMFHAYNILPGCTALVTDFEQSLLNTAQFKLRIASHVPFLWYLVLCHRFPVTMVQNMFQLSTLLSPLPFHLNTPEVFYIAILCYNNDLLTSYTQFYLTLNNKCTQ
jgi:hypothetical protein